MDKNEESNQIDMYINQVSSLLPYPNTTKKEALDELRIDVQSARKDSEGEPLSIVFGNPRNVAQNVSQGHDWHNKRAGWSIRLLAWLIDLIMEACLVLIILGAGFLLLLVIIPFEELMLEFSSWESGTSTLKFFSPQGLLFIAIITVLTLATVAAILGYNAALEYYFGKTIGKKLLSLAVVDKTGIKITWKQAIIRNFSKIIVSEELLPFDVILGMILERMDPEKTRNQRGLDILAETIVIRI